jgi:hypothetical protein
MQVLQYVGYTRFRENTHNLYRVYLLFYHLINLK